MQGDISVESEAEKGSIFRFTIQLEISKESKECTLFEKFDGANVLILDDNKSNRKIIRSYLEVAGCKVFEAEDIDKAITLIMMNSINKNEIELVIIDDKMPGMNGYQLATTLKTITFAKDIKLILLTSVAKEGDANTAKKQGFLRYISKPVRRDELLNCVSIVLGIKNESGVDTEIITMYPAKEERENLRSRILLVEDNEMNRKIVTKILKHKNMTCDIAIDGNEAIKALAVKDYDIVFMDCQMPVMDGYESTAKIREIEGNKRHTVIVAMTANAMEGDRIKCIEAGMDDYISKPINFDAMLKMIEVNRKPTSDHTKEHFDLIDDNVDAFVNSTGLNKDDAKEIFNNYIKYFPVLIEDIHKAVRNNNFEEIGKLAHQLKGSSGTLRINSIYELSKTLENSALNKEIEKCERLLMEIQKVFH